MQVSKWGNSLAVRLPKKIVEALELKPGDEIDIVLAGDRRFEVTRDMARDDALRRLRDLRQPLPRGFRFDRERANER